MHILGIVFISADTLDISLSAEKLGKLYKEFILLELNLFKKKISFMF